jgi:hypothetical protein
MRKCFTKRRLFLLLAAMVLVTGSVLLICWRWRIWGPSDYQTLQEVSRYPLGQDLWFGRISAGQDLESVMVQAPPHGVLHYGRFTVVHYYPGGPPTPGYLYLERMTIIAKDGRVVEAGAGGCGWAKVFFRMSPAEEAECKEAIDRHHVNHP